MEHTITSGQIVEIVTAIATLFGLVIRYFDRKKSARQTNKIVDGTKK